MENMVSNIVTGIIQRRQRKQRDPEIRKKAVETIARIKRMLKDYNVEVGRSAEGLKYPNEPTQNKRRGPNYIPRFKDPEEMNPQERERYESEYEDAPKDEYSYHSYSFRKDQEPDSIGVAKPDVRNLGKKKVKTPYLRALFILAHEAGHALQYGPPTKDAMNEINQDVEDATREIFKQIPQRGMSVVDYTKFVQTFIQAYTELMAWDRGRNFIPEELRDDFDNFAKTAYSSYLKARPFHEYYAVPMIKELLNKFNYHNYEEEETAPAPEGNIMKVPVKLMGMYKTPQELPNKRPYGFWMDKSGNFIPVGHEAHVEVAYEMLMAANKFLSENGQPEIDMSDLYWALQKRGFARIVFEPDARRQSVLWVDFSDEKRNTTPAQNRMIDEMMSKYNVHVTRRDEELG